MAYDKSKFDWSSKHTRIRAEMVISALLVFAVASLGIEAAETSLFPFDLSQLNPDLVIFGFFIWWLTSTLHFVVRTLTEYRSVFGVADEIRGITDRIETLSTNVTESLRRFEKTLEEFTSKGSRGEELDGFLERFRERLTKTAYRPPGLSTDLAPDRLDLFERSIRAILDNHVGDIRRLLQSDNEERTKWHESTSSDLRELTDGMRPWLEDVDQRIADFKSEILKANGAHRWDRSILGVWLPLAINILVVLSLPEIFCALLGLSAAMRPIPTDLGQFFTLPSL